MVLNRRARGSILPYAADKAVDKSEVAFIISLLQTFAASFAESIIIHFSLAITAIMESRGTEAPHRRFNPLSGDWVLVSPQRTARPWDGQLEASDTGSLPAYLPECYLCPGNVRAGGQKNPDYPATFVFTNDFAALLPEPAGAAAPDPEGLLVSEAERGLCRVICYSPP